MIKDHVFEAQTFVTKIQFVVFSGVLFLSVCYFFFIYKNRDKVEIWPIELKIIFLTVVFYIITLFMIFCGNIILYLKLQDKYFSYLKFQKLQQDMNINTDHFIGINPDQQQSLIDIITRQKQSKYED